MDRDDPNSPRPEDENFEDEGAYQEPGPDDSVLPPEEGAGDWQDQPVDDFADNTNYASEEPEQQHYSTPELNTEEASYPEEPTGEGAMEDDYVAQESNAGDSEFAQDGFSDEGMEHSEARQKAEAYLPPGMGENKFNPMKYLPYAVAGIVLLVIGIVGVPMVMNMMSGGGEEAPAQQAKNEPPKKVAANEPNKEVVAPPAETPPAPVGGTTRGPDFILQPANPAATPPVNAGPTALPPPSLPTAAAPPINAAPTPLNNAPTPMANAPMPPDAMPASPAGNMPQPMPMANAPVPPQPIPPAASNNNPALEQQIAKLNQQLEEMKSSQSDLQGKLDSAQAKASAAEEKVAKLQEEKANAPAPVSAGETDTPKASKKTKSAKASAPKVSVPSESDSVPYATEEKTVASKSSRSSKTASAKTAKGKSSSGKDADHMASQLQREVNARAGGGASQWQMPDGTSSLPRSGMGTGMGSKMPLPPGMMPNAGMPPQPMMPPAAGGSNSPLPMVANNNMPPPYQPGMDVPPSPWQQPDRGPMPAPMPVNDMGGAPMGGGGWVLRSAQPGQAWLSQGGSAELRRVQPGDKVPGLGTVVSVRMSAGRWLVEGTQGSVR
jgi:hypothetical protein